MDTYNGYSEEEFLLAEIKFDTDLPQFCEEQKFELYEIIDEEEEQVMNFTLLFNDRKNIETSEEGTVTYTGEIIQTEIDTPTISQVKIDKEDVEDFSEREFILKVL